MRLAWATDVHLDHANAEALESFDEELHRTRCGALLVTGDIAEGPTLERWIGWLADRLPLYFVLGNHDFYRSSIAEIRAQVRALGPRAVWLPAAGAVPLTAATALVGCDGFGDARAGDAEATPVRLNDHLLIHELAKIPRQDLTTRLRRLGDEDARVLERGLSEVAGRFRHVLVATHAPPLPEASFHEGGLSNTSWLPFFCCAAAGAVLRRAAAAEPRRALEVLCGHTHTAGILRAEENLVVRVGGARYGSPRVAAVIDVE